MPTNIIIVEDERIVAFNLQQRLISLGYQVSAIAVSAAQAFLQVEKNKPDLVLMDIHIEGELDGIETASQIITKYNIPVIYLTAYSEETTLIRARATRPHGYLLKPFSERELHATIQMALERHRVELALEQSEARLRLALTAAEMTDWELQQDQNKKETLYADRANRLLGYHERVFSGSREEFMLLVMGQDRARVNQAIDNSLQTNAPCDVEFRTVLPKEMQRWIRLLGKALENPGDNNIQIIGVIQDITVRKAAQYQLQQTATVFEAAQDGIIILDVHGWVTSCNKSYLAISGLTLDEIKGKSLNFLTPEAMRPEPYQALTAVFQNGGRWRGEVAITRNDGVSFPALITVASVDGRVAHLSHYVLVVTDLTAIRTVEQKLKHLAHHDPLTNLPNRLLTVERLNQALLRGKRHAERVAVLFIDLDHFKWINDSLGHAIGDAVLRQMSERMKACLRSDDTLGRLGGDEFLIVLDPCDSVQTVATVVRKLTDSVAKPLVLENHTIDISCSVGVSLFPEDGSNSEALICAADTAMYAAKSKGRNCSEFFTPAMLVKANRYLALTHDLRRGFNAGEMRLFYQPHVSLTSGKIVGVEALIRWQHPEKGLLGAVDIIPVAEDSGFINELGEWVIREACRQLIAWAKLDLPPIRMAVNVSAIQLLKPHFAAAVETILTNSRINPSEFEIEITESVLQQEGRGIATVEMLRNLGVRISIDDFGTGYSCLSSLKLLPIDTLKIDKAFIQDIPNDENDLAITDVIIDIAHKLKLNVIAEGVETVEQLNFLQVRGCDEVQGYLMSLPVPALQLSQLLIKQQKEPGSFRYLLEKI